MPSDKREWANRKRWRPSACSVQVTSSLLLFLFFAVIAIKQLEVTDVIFILFYLVMCSPAFTEEWKDAANSLEALVTSCVVIPCSFTAPAKQLYSSSLKGIWYRSKEAKEIVYDEDETRVVENFRGRTRMLGRLSQRNCTLEILDIKEHDSGAYCFVTVLAEGEADVPRSDKLSTPHYCVSLQTFSMWPTF